MHGPGNRAEEERNQSTGHVPSALSVDISSVITQVPARTAPTPPRPPPPAFRVQKLDYPPSVSWRARLRSLLCCFAPERGGYFKAEGEHVNVQSFGHRVGRGQTLIGPKLPQDAQKKTLVLDLDETLVHSSFKPIPNPDYIIPVDIDGKIVDVYVLKRPWLDHFMASVGEIYEVIVFTASLAKYADPLLDLLDKTKTIRWRLFRESCCPYQGNYVKDLSCMGRDLAQTIIVDNSPHSYIFQPQNALPIGTFIDDMDDRELLDMIPMLTTVSKVDDVRHHLVTMMQQYLPAASAW